MRQLKIIKLKKIRREPKDKKYAKAYFEARNIYRSKRSENYRLRLFMRRHSSKSRINLFSSAKINRCHKELIEFADIIEQKMAAMQLIPIDICETLVETDKLKIQILYKKTYLSFAYFSVATYSFLDFICHKL
jgi:hypothetical protein